MPDPGPKPLARVVDEIDLHALQTLLWNATSHGECPRCGGENWKAACPPTCVRCGWRPMEKGAYVALARQVLHRLQFEIAPSALAVRPLVRVPPLVLLGADAPPPEEPTLVEIELRVGCRLPRAATPGALRVAAEAMMNGLRKLIAEKFIEVFPEVIAAMTAEQGAPSDEAHDGNAAP